VLYVCLVPRPYVICFILLWDLLGVSRSRERDLLTVLSIYPRSVFCIFIVYCRILFCNMLMSVDCFGLVVSTCPPSIWPHLFCGAGREKRRGEQLKWSLAFTLYIGSFPCAQLPAPVHTARVGWMCFLCIFSLGLCFVCILVLFNLFVSPFFCVFLGSWVISQLKRCVHELSKLQKSGFEKIAIEVVDMQSAKIQLNSGLAKYILYGLA